MSCRSFEIRFAEFRQANPFMSYKECRKELGRRGGRVSGLRRSSDAAALKRERSKQEAMHIR